ncbi:hypothetical protein CC2G_014120 [Coprinopsis cinerea AmutBmut pab1-1]|nr:hypothetical protein CC2G_014120 [Coprinopsis cinerea AmutBmut pab1-1]
MVPHCQRRHGQQSNATADTSRQFTYVQTTVVVLSTRYGDCLTMVWKTRVTVWTSPSSADTCEWTVMSDISQKRKGRAHTPLKARMETRVKKASLSCMVDVEGTGNGRGAGRVTGDSGSYSERAARALEVQPSLSY